MTASKNKKNIVRVACGLLLVLLVQGLFSAALEAEVCEKAFERCMADALFTAVVSLNVGVLVGFSASCLMGYEWCLIYYAEAV